MSEKHGFRIVDDEIALLMRCDSETFAYESVGIYQDSPTKCPVCGELLVLRVGHSYLEATQPPEAK